MTLEIVPAGESIIKKERYRFRLRDYPQIQAWEWNNILAFLCYEKAQGRESEIICENKDILSSVQNAADQLDGTEYIPPIAEAIEEFVYHATDVHAAQKILTDGKLLSATKVYGKTGEAIAFERRECEWNDPADFYEYIMFGWGTHLVGDYVVLSENFPSEEDLRKGNFNAGVRFYMKYEDLIQHKGHTFDGYHAIKVKDEIVLSDYLFACIVPQQYKGLLENCIPQELLPKVHYLTQKGLNLQEWNDKVVAYMKKLSTTSRCLKE